MYLVRLAAVHPGSIECFRAGRVTATLCEAVDGGINAIMLCWIERHRFVNQEFSLEL